MCTGTKVKHLYLINYLFIFVALLVNFVCPVSEKIKSLVLKRQPHNFERKVLETTIWYLEGTNGIMNTLFCQSSSQNTYCSINLSSVSSLCPLGQSFLSFKTYQKGPMSRVLSSELRLCSNAISNKKNHGKKSFHFCSSFSISVKWDVWMNSSLGFFPVPRLLWKLHCICVHW